MSQAPRHRLSVTVGPPGRPAQAPTAAPLTPVQMADLALQRGRPDAALAVLVQAQVRERRDPQGMQLLAIACVRQQDLAQAEAIWRELLAMPDPPVGVLTNLAHLLEQTGRAQEALELLQRAVATDPDDYSAQLNLGTCLDALGQTDASRAHTRLAADLRPDLAQPWFNLGCVWQAEDDFEQAQASYDRALSIDPGHLGAISNALFLQHFLPGVGPQERLRRACELGDALCRTIQPMPLPPRRAPGPLRVGLLSADFRAHSVGWFLSGFLPEVDRAQVHLTAFSNGITSDALTAPLRAACSDWHEIAHLGDQSAAERIRAQGIDVLVDLSGMTAGHRLGVLARRPAPVQVNWLGYFGTSGLPTMDAILADPWCVPEGEERLYRERVWRLPHSRFCMAPPDEAPAVAPLPALANGYPTLGSFQELAKLNDRVLDLWGQVMRALPLARLRIQSRRLHDLREADRLLCRLAAAGIAAERCDLRPSGTRAAYLGAHREVDFLLDSFPYTGGTTTCEALWMGVPTLTLASPGMLERQGEAHLRNVGLTDWVAHSEEQFVQRALFHASPQSLNALAETRSGLRERCRTSPLFDNRRFARDWKQALQAIHAQHVSSH